jgi:hypothetical protein
MVTSCVSVCQTPPVLAERTNKLAIVKNTERALSQLKELELDIAARLEHKVIQGSE